ncbi:MAG: cell division protein FtsL [Francisellaceae bacterium]|nr:cell division protein FtsL [Francisellaceae bacterium]
MNMKKPLSPLFFIKFKPLLGITFLIMGVVSTALAVVYTKHQSRTLYAKLQDLQSQRDDLHIEWSQLLLEKGAWANDARVERVAREQLSMEMPQLNQIVIIKP